MTEKEKEMKELALQHSRDSYSEYNRRMDRVLDKLDDDTTPDKIKLDILEFLDRESKRCKKCEKLFDDLVKLSGGRDE